MQLAAQVEPQPLHAAHRQARPPGAGAGAGAGAYVHARVCACARVRVCVRMWGRFCVRAPRERRPQQLLLERYHLGHVHLKPRDSGRSSR